MSVDPNEGMDGLRQIVRPYETFGIRAVERVPARHVPAGRASTTRRCTRSTPSAVSSASRLRAAPACPARGSSSRRRRSSYIDEVMYDFPELVFVTRHGCEPWTDLAVKLMLKWPGLHYSTSAFAPKHYPKAIIDYANTRGADKIIYAGYFPMGLSLERIMTRHAERPFKDDVWPKFLRDNAERVLKVEVTTLAWHDDERLTPEQRAARAVVRARRSRSHDGRRARRARARCSCSGRGLRACSRSCARRAFGDRPFFVFPEETVTFAECRASWRKVAAVLADEYGVGHGDRLAIAPANCRVRAGGMGRGVARRDHRRAQRLVDRGRARVRRGAQRPRRRLRRRRRAAASVGSKSGSEALDDVRHVEQRGARRRCPTSPSTKTTRS